MKSLFTERTVEMVIVKFLLGDCWFYSVQKNIRADEKINLFYESIVGSSDIITDLYFIYTVFITSNWSGFKILPSQVLGKCNNWNSILEKIIEKTKNHMQFSRNLFIASFEEIKASEKIQPIITNHQYDWKFVHNEQTQNFMSKKLRV